MTLQLAVVNLSTQRSSSGPKPFHNVRAKYVEKLPSAKETLFSLSLRMYRKSYCTTQCQR